MKKKFLVSALSSVFVIGALAACGNAEDDPAGNTGINDPVINEDTTEPANDPAEEPMNEPADNGMENEPVDDGMGNDDLIDNESNM